MNAVSHLRAEPARIRETTWKEYAVRFAFGGAITAVVGVLGKAFGPVVAGLFLAFPAILPASLTLVASDETDRAAAADALGAAVGSVGLAAFGVVIWASASRGAAVVVLAAATVAWLAAAVGLWAALVWLRESRRPG